MPELLALTRLALVRSRLLLLMMMSAVVIAAATAYVAGPIGQDSTGQQIAIFTLFLTLMPAALSSVVLFDYSAEGNMNLPESGCSHWILRMPVKSWKVASVPLILKTLWVTALWVLFVFIARYLGAEDEIPFVAPSICFSATAIWVLVLAWRPFRSGWHRIVALTLTVPILYCCIVAVFVAPNLKMVQWRPSATYATLAGVIVLYGAGVWLAIRTVSLARTSVTGVIPEFGKQREAGWLSGGGDRERHYRSPVHTLISHDLIKSQGWIRKTFILGVIPAILIFSLFIPVSVPAVVLVFWVFAYLAAIAISRTGYTPDSSIPPYLAASPLSNATIAWTKFAGPMVVATIVFFFILFVFAGWGCWAENRSVWLQWSSLRARDVGSTDTLMIGLRWSVAVVIASATFALGRLASYFWIGMAGRQWLGVVMAVVMGLTVLIPIGVVIRWFLHQHDWESTKMSALYYAGFLPAIVIGLLVVKGLAVAISIAALTSRKLISQRNCLQVIAIWTVITLSVATSLAILIPDSRATFLWCLGFTALAIPLARVLALPASLAWNRHR
jgi:hypothetical protein